MRRDRGFTLIELIVVLVIMGIVAGVTAPRYAGSFDSIRFRKTMSELVYFLREARIKAMATARTTHVVFDLNKGFCWNDDKKIFKLPNKIEMFTDEIEARDDQTKIFTFYPNGTALDEKIGFVCDKMVAVLHVEPLGGLPNYKINGEMEPIVRYKRDEEEPGNDDIEKAIDKLKDSDKLTINEQTSGADINDDLEDEDYEEGDVESDDEIGYFNEEDAADDDTEKE